MARVLGLHGREPSTRFQMEALLAALGAGAEAIQAYGFWEDADYSDPELGLEAAVAGASGAEVVVAKSIGTLVTLLAGRDHGLAPKACVFLATPMRRFQAQGWVSLLEDHCAAIPTLFIQQTDDFNGAHADLATVVAPHRECRALEIPGADHLYEDIGRIAPPVRDWLAGRGLAVL